jgi:hypothetical protein
LGRAHSIPADVFLLLTPLPDLVFIRLQLEIVCILRAIRWIFRSNSMPIMISSSWVRWFDST